MNTYTFGALLGTTLLISVVQSAYITENSHDVFTGVKRASNQCRGIKCRDAPESNCKEVSEGKSGVTACCPDYECTSPDGTVSKHSGIAGKGSSGTEYDYTTPDGKGHVKAQSRSSFSSSSSSSNGPGAMKDFKFDMPKPPSFQPPPHMGPPPGFFDNMPKPPHMGPPDGFPHMGPPPGFFDNMPKPPPMPPMPHFGGF